MKLFKSILVATTAIALSACSTTYTTEKTENETISALAMDQKNLYVMGTQHDYQFPTENTQRIQNLVKSPYAKKMSYVAISGEVHNQKEVKAALTLVASPMNFTKTQQEDLVQNYGFRVISDIPKTSVYYQNPTLAKSLKKSPSLLKYDQRLSDGKMVQIKNRQTFIQQYPLSQPIHLKLEYIKSSSKVNGTDAAVIIGLPILFIAAAPLYLICETGNGC